MHRSKEVAETARQHFLSFPSGIGRAGGESSLHTGEVVGSLPTAPTTPEAVRLADRISKC